MVTKGQKWKQNRNITPEEFVKVFVEKSSFEEVAEHFGISVSSVRNRAYSLKRSGVNLNTKKKSGQKAFFGTVGFDVDSLNKIAQKANK